MQKLNDPGVDETERDARRDWIATALRRIHSEAARSAATPLLRAPFTTAEGVDVYLKDESVHPTGSLKHRLARSLFVAALCDGSIGPDTIVVEASSGSTAVSEAYFARLLGLPFLAVVPRGTSSEKLDLIRLYGGRCHVTASAGDVTGEARALADECGGHFMDQFTHAARATDWRSGNIAAEIFDQMRGEPEPVPAWFVVGAGTGGTSTCVARYARYRSHPTRVAVVDPEGSAFYEGWRRNDRSVITSATSRIEGIGRPRVEPSFFPELVDEVLPLPDAASIAAARWCSTHLGRPVGASTGANVWGTLVLAGRLARAGRRASIVSVICDSGIRYSSTYFNDDWLTENGLDITPYAHALERYDSTGVLETESAFSAQRA